MPKPITISTIALFSLSLCGTYFASTAPNNTSSEPIVQASTRYIPFSQFDNDYSEMISVAAETNPDTNLDSHFINVSCDAISKNPSIAYTNEDTGFGSLLFDIGMDLQDAQPSPKDASDHAFEQDLTALKDANDYLNPRFSQTEQTKLAHLWNDVNTEVAEYSRNARIADYTGEENISANIAGRDYGVELSNALIEWGRNIKVGAFDVNAITLAKAKKTSKNYIKVTGYTELYIPSKYAKIVTYRGTRYAKLKNYAFSKLIYAPKAKHVKITVGNYSHSKFTAVTPTKTISVKK